MFCICLNIPIHELADGYKCEYVETGREVIDEILSDVFAGRMWEMMLTTWDYSSLSVCQVQIGLARINIFLTRLIFLKKGFSYNYHFLHAFLIYK